MGTVQFFDANEHQFTNLLEVFNGRETPIPAAELAATDVRVHHSETDGLQLFELPPGHAARATSKTRHRGVGELPRPKTRAARQRRRKRDHRGRRR